MKTEKEIEKYLEECLEENDKNENKNTGYDKVLSTELQARIKTLTWVLKDNE